MIAAEKPPTEARVLYDDRSDSPDDSGYCLPQPHFAKAKCEGQANFSWTKGAQVAGAALSDKPQSYFLRWRRSQGPGNGPAKEGAGRLQVWERPPHSWGFQQSTSYGKQEETNAAPPRPHLPGSPSRPRLSRGRSAVGVCVCGGRLCVWHSSASAPSYLRGLEAPRFAILPRRPPSLSRVARRFPEGRGKARRPARAGGGARAPRGRPGAGLGVRGGRGVVTSRAPVVL